MATTKGCRQSHVTALHTAAKLYTDKHGFNMRAGCCAAACRLPLCCFEMYTQPCFAVMSCYPQSIWRCSHNPTLCTVSSTNKIGMGHLLILS